MNNIREGFFIGAQLMTAPIVSVLIYKGVAWLYNNADWEDKSKKQTKQKLLTPQPK